MTPLISPAAYAAPEDARALLTVHPADWPRIAAAASLCVDFPIAVVAPGILRAGARFFPSDEGGIAAAVLLWKLLRRWRELADPRVLEVCVGFDLGAPALTHDEREEVCELLADAGRALGVEASLSGQAVLQCTFSRAPREA